jgi:hypothetical protein
MQTVRSSWKRTWAPFLWVRRCSAMLTTAPTIEFLGWWEWRASIMTPTDRPFFPKVSRLDPWRFGGDTWVIDGRRSERYTSKTWRMCVHYVLALTFG